MSDLPKYIAELTLKMAQGKGVILGWCEARKNRVKVTWLDPDDKPQHDVIEWSEVPRFILAIKRLRQGEVA